MNKPKSKIKITKGESVKVIGKAVPKGKVKSSTDLTLNVIHKKKEVSKVKKVHRPSKQEKEENSRYRWLRFFNHAMLGKIHEICVKDNNYLLMDIIPGIGVLLSRSKELCIKIVNNNSQFQPYETTINQKLSLLNIIWWNSERKEEPNNPEIPREIMFFIDKKIPCHKVRSIEGLIEVMEKI
jgi:hypothetical protein